MNILKKSVIAALFGVAGIAYYLASQEPPRTPEQVALTKTVSAPEPVVAEAPPVEPEASKPAPVVAQKTPDTSPAREQPRIEVADEQALIDYNLKAIEQMRRIPGAAPLVDEIVDFLKSDHANEVSLNNIPADRNGLSVLDEHTMEHMVSNEAIRAKWTKLMALVAAHPEALRPEENNE